MGVITRVQQSFVAGLLLLTPLAVTVFVLQFVFRVVTDLVDPIVRATGVAAYVDDVTVAAQLLTVVLLVLGTTTLGYVASRSVGAWLFGGFERGVRLIPFVRTVYFGVQQVSESLLERADGYDRVVLVEYPRRGAYVIGFVTNRSPAAAATAVEAGGDEGSEHDQLYNVFLPNSPNPTGGQLLLLPESKLWEVDMSVRRGLRLLLTTGLSTAAVDDDLPPPERGDATATATDGARGEGDDGRRPG